MVMERGLGCRTWVEAKRFSSSRLEPYWLKGIGCTVNLAGAEAGFDVEWSLAEGGGTLLLPTEDLEPGFFNNFF
jgi:hypothetical protein